MEQQVPAYEVLSTQDSMMRNQQGISVASKIVNVRFADGTHSHVEVPNVPNWSNEAKDAIEALYEEHLTVMSLKGPMVSIRNRKPQYASSNTP